MSDFRYTRPSSFPPIVKNLIIINVLVFVAQLTLEKTYHLTEKILLYPIIPKELEKIVATSDISYYGFKPYQIFTHMFAHSPDLIFHILFNMLVLWMFGRVLENVWGPKRFLFFYLACGIGAALLHLGVQYFRSEQLLEALQAGNQAAIAKYQGALAGALGASGAIMGVMAAFAFLFPNTPLFIMFIPIPVKAKWAILGFIALDLFGGINPSQGDNIAHFAHLGGAITGFIIVLIWNKTNRKTLY